MGKIDTESKQYVNYPDIFADIFNYFLYDGEPVIKPENLRPTDTTEVAVAYGNNARMPVQKYRDSFKVWNAMEDDNCCYVLLGTEIQSAIHYAMPVKDMLYDALTYASQVDAARKSYKDNHNEAEIVIDNESVRLKLTREEFLSGFRKGDKLMPVITVVVYFGPEKWNGPLSIHDMLSYKDERILKAIPDYKINLVAPANIPDKDFDEKFSTGLGLVLNALKHSQGNVLDVLRNTRRKAVDRKSAEFIRDALDLPITFEDKDIDEKGDVLMSQATQNYIEKEKILAVINAYKQIGMSEKDIIGNILKQYENVTEQEIIDLLHHAA